MVSESLILEAFLSTMFNFKCIFIAKYVPIIILYCFIIFFIIKGHEHLGKAEAGI